VGSRTFGSKWRRATRRRAHHGSPSPAGKLPRRVASECRTALPQTSSSPCRLACVFGRSIASLRSTRITGFITNTDPSVPVSRFGTLVLTGHPARISPLASRPRFPRSTLEPDSESRHLHTGCRLGRNQVTPQTRPGVTKPPGFDIVYTFSRRPQWFAFARLSEPHLTRSSLAFSVALTTTAFDRRSLRRFGAAPDHRLRGTPTLISNVASHLRQCVRGAPSSTCHLSPGRGRRQRRRLAKIWPNLSHHRRPVSWETTMPAQPKAARRHGRLRLNTWYSHTAWLITAAGKRWR
jgi:hypothetical protein